MKKNRIKHVVKEKYGRIAEESGSCCASSCCTGSGPGAEETSRKLGYSDSELRAVPEGANLGLGCGNPLALAALQPGETVLDLGSGAGFDSFLAAARVGPEGRVIGVDMTAEMVARARENARRGGFTNVEFHEGEIESLPIDDGSIDIIISNCVINLSPDKECVFQEAFRVLKPGGRLMISDIVLLEKLPESIRNSIEAYVGCVAGATLKRDYLRLIESAGFRDIRVVDETVFFSDSLAGDPLIKDITAKLEISDQELLRVGSTVMSVKIEAFKPQVTA